MAKSDKKAHQYRMDGMEYALRIADKDGIDELRRQVAIRKAVFVPLEITPELLMECSNQLKERLMESIMTVACMTMNEEFGFGKERLQRFVDQFNYQTECLDDVDGNGNPRVCIWEMAEYLNERYGFEFDVKLLKKINEEVLELRKGV